MSRDRSGEDSTEYNVQLSQIRDYWNEQIHDLEITTQPMGSVGFFQELEEYRYDKLAYLPKIVDFSAYGNKQILEVGCGVGIDLIRFVREGAAVTGVDLSEVAIDLASQNFRHNHLEGKLQVMNGEALKYADKSFDMVYCHGVLGYTANPIEMVSEIQRVLRHEGQAIIMVYNAYSWLNALSKIMKVELEHEDAPYLKKYSIWEFKRLLESFSQVQIVPERFPVRTRLHHGLKAKLYNGLFVTLFNVLPRSLVRPSGWHLMAFATKS